MSEELQPVVLVQRWQHHDVCAVLGDHAVGWVIRDVLVAVEGDAGDFDDEPGHSPLVIAEHAYARTWTYDQVRQQLEATSRAESLLHWMREREHSLAAVGFGNVVRIGSAPSRLDGPVYSVSAAVDVLNRDPSIDTGVRRLFDWLLAKQWILRRGQEYAPAQSAVDSALLAVRPRRLPHSGNPWPQIVLTDVGLAELHALLGGSNPAVLEQEPTR